MKHRRHAWSSISTISVSAEIPKTEHSIHFLDLISLVSSGNLGKWHNQTWNRSLTETNQYILIKYTKTVPSLPDEPLWVRYTSKVTADNSLEYTTAKLSTTLLKMTSSSLVFKKESSLVLSGYKYTSSVHFQAGGGDFERTPNIPWAVAAGRVWPRPFPLVWLCGQSE